MNIYKYEYQILRYVHDQVTEEFVNIGVVIYSKELNIIKAKFINKTSRLTKFFSDVKHNFILKVLNSYENTFNHFFENNDLDLDNLEQITSFVLPKDDCTMSFSPIKKGIVPKMDSEPSELFDHVLDDLFNRLVSQYIEDRDLIKDDNYVWKQLYKKYFDEYKLTSKLKKHDVYTNADKFEFDKSWKNGSWHCYQALSFDLKNEKNIKDKVYQWASRLQELDTASEEIKLYLLTSLPKDRPDLQIFIRNKLTEVKTHNLEVEIVEENQASQIALTVKREMELSAAK